MMMTRDELENLQDSAADKVLAARERIEAAVDAGELPIWVIEALTAVESASLLYGATSERIRLQLDSTLVEGPGEAVLH